MTQCQKEDKETDVKVPKPMRSLRTTVCRFRGVASEHETVSVCEGGEVNREYPGASQFVSQAR